MGKLVEWDGYENKRYGKRLKRVEYNVDEEGEEVDMIVMGYGLRSLNGYIMTQFSDRDSVIVRLECIKVSIISLYCDINESIHKSMINVCKEHLENRRMIICIDTNAHCISWGVSGNRRNRFKSYARGDKMCDLIDELDLCVCNKVPYLSMYVGDIGFLTHIDAMLCSNGMYNRIRNWEVIYEQFESDYRVILFDMLYINKMNGKDDKVSHGIPWLRPSNTMGERFNECLLKMVKFRRRVVTVEDAMFFMQKHSMEVQEALSKIYNKKGKEVYTPCYWWTKTVSQLHRKLKVAKRRMIRYGYRNLVMEYNMCRKTFREKVECKVSSWKEFTSNIVDPWKGLIKILKREDVNKAQEGMLCDIEGEYVKDLKNILCLFGDQFYPKPKEYLDEHKLMEKFVSEELVNVHEGEDITICEFRKALSKMKKAMAPCDNTITNYVLQILSKKCKYKKSYISVFNVCLRYGIFLDAWKQARIVLIPKPSAVLDSVKSMRPIYLPSVFSKLLERIVVARILYYIEILGNLSISQHAYRKGSSIITALYQASRFVQDALHDKQIYIIEFLDISGAFDRTWYGGILYRLLQYGVLKYLVKWIKCFLADRLVQFRSARVEYTVKLNQSCPQGGVLSPVLWNVMFNNVLVIKIKADQDFHLKVVGYTNNTS